MLHLNLTAVHSVSVASHPAEFVHSDPLSNLSVSPDCHNHSELKRKIYSALAESDEGELSIAIPKEVSVKQSGQATVGIASEGKPTTSHQRQLSIHGFNSLAATPEPQTPGFPQQTHASIPEFAPIVVNIVYSLRSPTDGIQFVLPTDSYPYVSFHDLQSPNLYSRRSFSVCLMSIPHRLPPMLQGAGCPAWIISGRSARGSLSLLFRATSSNEKPLLMKTTSHRMVIVPRSLSAVVSLWSRCVHYSIFSSIES